MAQSQHAEDVHHSSKNPSVLLSHTDFHKVTEQATLTCKGSRDARFKATSYNITYSMVDVIGNITAHKRVRRAEMFGAGKRLSILTCGGAFPTLLQTTSSRGRKVSMNHIGLNTPADILCLEYRLLLGEFDAVLARIEQTERLLTKFHDITFLEAHFGVHFLLPNRETVHTFEDKMRFSTWMEQSGLGAFIPQTFRNVSDVRFPAVVKITGGE